MPEAYFCARLSFLNDPFFFFIVLSPSSFQSVPPPTSRLTRQGLHSYRLVETLGAGAIPVIVADDFVLPFADCLDWSTFSLRLRESQLLQLPDLVRAIPSEQMIRMQENALAAYRRYFANTSLVVLKSLEILERRFNVSQGRLVQPC